MVEESGGKDQLQRWVYETHFREYARLLGRKGNEALESISRFPQKIELDKTWHTVLDRLRAETKTDGFERYALIGYRPNSTEFYFPELPAKGEPSSIPRAVKGDMRWKAWEKYGVTAVVGDFHTHPGGSAFSMPDLFGFLNKFSGPKPFIRGLANEQENIFAFRTGETFMVSEIDTPEKRFSAVFEDYWLEQAGYKNDADRVHIVPVIPDANIWKANLGIAEAHRLALYRGKPGEDLIRAYP